MKDEAWFRMLALSAIFHLLVIGVFSFTVKKGGKKIDLPSSYSVSLVGDLGGAGGIRKQTQQPKALPEKPAPQPRVDRKTPPKLKETAKEISQRQKPILQRQEKEAVSLSSKKVPPKPMPQEQAPKPASPSQAELSRLEERLKEIKKRTEYFDVAPTKPGKTADKPGSAPGTGTAGMAFSSGGESSQLDPATQKYYMEVMEKVREAWGTFPGLSYKNLKTEVTIKVRKDGRITDISLDSKSGNRMFDEKVIRTLRSVEPLPPIPGSLNRDALEVPFRFHPGEL